MMERRIMLDARWHWPMPAPSVLEDKPSTRIRVDPKTRTGWLIDMAGGAYIILRGDESASVDQTEATKVELEFRRGGATEDAWLPHDHPEMVSLIEAELADAASR
jgi:hypothetical protein